MNFGPSEVITEVIGFNSMDQFLPDGNQHNDSDAYVAVSF